MVFTFASTGSSVYHNGQNLEIKLALQNADTISADTSNLSLTLTNLTNLQENPIVTTLYNWQIRKGKGYVIHHRVAGDLSHTYAVRTPDMVTPGDWGLQGTGIQTRTLKEATYAGKLVAKHGYKKVSDMWDKKYHSTKYSFGYLSGSTKLAKQLAPLAYGDYAEKIKQKCYAKRYSRKKRR